MEIQKHSPQKVRDERRALSRAVLNYPDQLATHILKIPLVAKYLCVTRTRNSGVNARNQSNC